LLEDQGEGLSAATDRVAAGEVDPNPGGEPMTNAKNMKQLVAAIERGEGDDKKSFWTRIGVAFENKDGSWNLRFDFLPARPDGTTVQLRDFEQKEKDAAKLAA
jgi:hypothetical protein